MRGRMDIDKAFVGDSVTVVVHAVADFGRTRKDRIIVVIAIGGGAPSPDFYDASGFGVGQKTEGFLPLNFLSVALPP